MNAFAPSSGQHKGWTVERAETSAWLHRPLCRRYAFAQFGRSIIRLRGQDANASQEWRWAVGVLLNGQQEVLGAWHAKAGPRDLEIWADLESRGVETIVAIGTDEQNFSEHESLAMGWRATRNSPSARPVRHSTLEKRSNETRSRAAEVVAQAQRAIDRAARRHGPLIDSDAEGLISNVLRRLDCDLSLSARQTSVGLTSQSPMERR